MKVWLCALASICIASAVPLNVDETKVEDTRESRNPLIEGIVLGLIEDLRNTILYGSDDLPVLDPLVIDELHIDDETIPLPGAQLSIADTTVKNLGTFDVYDLSVSSVLVRNWIDLSGYIPVIEIDNGWYNLDLNALGFTIFGTGDSNFKIIEPRIKASLTITVGLISGMTVTECDVEFSLGSFEPDIRGLFGHEGASQFASLFVKNLVTELLTTYETEINEFLSEIVQDVVQGALP